jgi:hypothetical protein
MPVSERVIDLDELEVVVLKLKDLLADRHPGLWTWQMMMGDRMRELERILNGEGSCLKV